MAEQARVSLAPSTDGQKLSLSANWICRIALDVPAILPNVTDGVGLEPFPQLNWPPEVNRRNWGLVAPVQQGLSAEYFDSLRLLPSLIAAAASREWNAEYLACVLAALAAAKGYGVIAEAVLELRADNAEKFLEWLNEQ
jgi:hypothetical protein